MSRSALVRSAVLFLTASAVFGQSSTSIRVTVPFEFVAGQSSFTAGEYSVISPAPGVVEIRNQNGSHAALVLANRAQLLHAPDTSELVFRVYGDRYFLSQIWTAGNAIGKEIPKSHAQRAWIAAHRSSRVVTVAATLR